MANNHRNNTGRRRSSSQDRNRAASAQDDENGDNAAPQDNMQPPSATLSILEQQRRISQISMNATSRLTNSFGLAPFGAHEALFNESMARARPDLFPVPSNFQQQIGQIGTDHQQQERGNNNNGVEHFLPRVAQNSVSSSTTRLLWQQFQQPDDYQNVFSSASLAEASNAGNQQHHQQHTGAADTAHMEADDAANDRTQTEAGASREILSSGLLLPGMDQSGIISASSTSEDVGGSGREMVPMEADDEEEDNHEIQVEIAPSHASWPSSAALLTRDHPQLEDSGLLSSAAVSLLQDRNLQSQISGDIRGQILGAAASVGVAQPMSMEIAVASAPAEDNIKDPRPPEAGSKLPSTVQDEKQPSSARGASLGSVAARVPMAIPSSDQAHFSPLECLVRQQLEFFATLTDGAKQASGRRGDDTVVVGIQCRHCGGGGGPRRTEAQALNNSSRSALPYQSFPSNLRAIREAAMTLARTHLCEACPGVPPGMTLLPLATAVSSTQQDHHPMEAEDQSQAENTGDHWVEAALSQGIVEVKDGLCFSPDLMAAMASTSDVNPL